MNGYRNIHWSLSKFLNSIIHLSKPFKWPLATYCFINIKKMTILCQTMSKWTAIIPQQWVILDDLEGGPGYIGYFIWSLGFHNWEVSYRDAS